MSEAAKPDLLLPPSLIGRADLARLIREVEDLDNELEAQTARNRTSGATGYHMPNMSQSLHDFVELNQLDLADGQARMHLKERLKAMKEKAPVVHMTFAVEADPQSLQKLVNYLRTEIHPQALLTVGLQPRLVAGAYIRTPNHIHDFTVRELMEARREVMIKDLESLLR